MYLHSIQFWKTPIKFKKYPYLSPITHLTMSLCTCYITNTFIQRKFEVLFSIYTQKCCNLPYNNQ